MLPLDSRQIHENVPGISEPNTSLPKPEPKVTAAPVAVSSGDDGTIQNMVLVGFVLVFLLLV